MDEGAIVAAIAEVITASIFISVGAVPAWILARYLHQAGRSKLFRYSLAVVDYLLMIGSFAFAAAPGFDGGRAFFAALVFLHGMAWFKTRKPPKPSAGAEPVPVPEPKAAPAKSSEFKPAPPLPGDWNTSLNFGKDKPTPSAAVFDPAPHKPPARSPRGHRQGGEIISFIYTDSQGETTERRLIVHMVDDTYIEGYCFTRLAPRTFRLDRIEDKILCEDTGELVLPWEWAARHW